MRLRSILLRPIVHYANTATQSLNARHSPINYTDELGSTIVLAPFSRNA